MNIDEHGEEILETMWIKTQEEKITPKAEEFQQKALRAAHRGRLDGLRRRRQLVAHRKRLARSP